MIKPFSRKINNIECRSCDKSLFVKDCEHLTAEIIEWFDNESKNCYAIAYWVEGKEGFDLNFVHKRPSKKSVNKKDFFKLFKFGQKKLDKYFDKKQEDC